MESEYKILEKLVCEGKDVHIVTENIAEKTFLVQVEPQLMLLVKDNRTDFRPHYVLLELDYVHTKMYEEGLKAWHDMQEGKAIQLNKFLDYYKSLKK